MFKVNTIASRTNLRASRQFFFKQNNLRLVATMTSTTSAISAAIKKDHRELEEYYENIINAADEDTATRWQNQFTWELARHSIAEELVVYPAMEKNLGEKGVQMANKDRKEH